MPKTSYRTSRFGESVIRGMTRLANECGAINLSQGYPDFDPPEAVLQAAGNPQGVRFVYGVEGLFQYLSQWAGF